ncbi:hypothetical protein [Oceanirhabdus sp. W0125-5]|uniref:hypothetical protein n=1 Tax=Oceanirhabdus sp. W0125-5 TaxID=2999116 RepID=UPI0022F2E417|nr:hypothetical protein [Oceanirhabdus sp. W0125-5]WBW96832.1 hypothetical protein OW730_24550 [Oceanirhabdus sp. W0125-5]
MKKIHYVSIIILLIISNLFTIFFYSDYKLKHSRTLKSNIKEAYLLHGQNSNWLFKGGNIFLGDYQDLFVGSSIKYIGTKELKTDTITATISVRDKNTDVLKTPVNGTHFSSDNFSTTSLNGTLEIPLGTGLTSSECKLNYSYDLDSNSVVYVDIEYVIDGELIKERFELHSISIDLNQ